MTIAEHHPTIEPNKARLDNRRASRSASHIQEVTGDHVELVYVNEGYTCQQAAEDAQAHGIKLEVVKLSEAKKGFVLLPKRWVVKRSFGWAARLKRLSRAYELLASTLAGLHWVAFSTLMLSSLFPKG